MLLYSVPKSVPGLIDKYFIHYFLNFWRIAIGASRGSSPNWLLSFVANNPIVENALSGSRDVGLIVRRALNNFCRCSGLFLVASKRLISFLTMQLSTSS